MLIHDATKTIVLSTSKENKQWLKFYSVAMIDLEVKKGQSAYK